MKKLEKLKTITFFVHLEQHTNKIWYNVRRTTYDARRYIWDPNGEQTLLLYMKFIFFSSLCTLYLLWLLICELTIHITWALSAERLCNSACMEISIESTHRTIHKQPAPYYKYLLFFYPLLKPFFLRKSNEIANTFFFLCTKHLAHASCLCIFTVNLQTKNEEKITSEYWIIACLSPANNHMSTEHRRKIYFYNLRCCYFPKMTNCYYVIDAESDAVRLEAAVFAFFFKKTAYVRIMRTQFTQFRQVQSFKNILQSWLTFFSARASLISKYTQQQQKRDPKQSRTFHFQSK